MSVNLGAIKPGINAALTAYGAISGTVTDAGSTHHGLENVHVVVSSQSTGFSGYAMTDADGKYTVKGLEAGDNYEVCFTASYASGGSWDPLGYADQCYNNQPISGTQTPVSVALGQTTIGIKAALVRAGAISGMVSDAGSTQHGLSNVQVRVSFSSTGDRKDTWTATDGSWSVKGLAAGDDYQVCFTASYARGGSSDALGYADQCYSSQPADVGHTDTGERGPKSGHDRDQRRASSKGERLGLIEVRHRRRDGLGVAGRSPATP